MKKLFLASAFAVVACGGGNIPPEPSVEVNIDVNGTTGDDINDAFFGLGVLEDSPLFVSEDRDGDGNLDVAEDLNFDGNLDVAEDANNNGILDPGEDADGDGILDLNAETDVDGDGVADPLNEDSNANGVLDLEIQVDVNEDGTISEQDNVTISFFVLAASDGGVSCDELVTSFEGGGEAGIDGVTFATIGTQLELGPNIEVAFRSGQLVTTTFKGDEGVGIFSTFGAFVAGETVAGSSAESDASTILLDIETLDDTLTASISGSMNDENALVVPFTADFVNTPECAALSASIQVLIESGQLFN